jgi:CDP-4-dehydro-6-deoxyglucose reductase, E3
MPFTVTIQPANKAFEVAADEPILAASIRANIGLPYGCRDGACGSCKSKLLQGRVMHGAHQLKALSVAEEEAGFILPCCATPQTDCVVESRSVVAVGDYPVQRMPARLASMSKPAPDVAVLKLQLPATMAVKYRAGQYVEFILRDGSRRSYSMANAPHLVGEPPVIELHLRHMPGGAFTDHVFGAMKEKEIFRVEGPFGTFFLREDSPKPIVLLASGTGFAPIKALIEHMQHKGIRRPATLYWGCRSKRDLYMHAWVEQQAAQGGLDLRYVPVLSEAQPHDAWRGRTGLVHEAVLHDIPDLSGHEVYACGAPIMVDSARRDFTVQGKLPEDAFFADSFTSQRDKAA